MYDFSTTKLPIAILMQTIASAPNSSIALNGVPIICRNCGPGGDFACQPFQLPCALRNDLFGRLLCGSKCALPQWTGHECAQPDCNLRGLHRWRQPHKPCRSAGCQLYGYDPVPLVAFWYGRSLSVPGQILLKMAGIKQQLTRGADTFQHLREG